MRWWMVLILIMITVVGVGVWFMAIPKPQEQIKGARVTRISPIMKRINSGQNPLHILIGRGIRGATTNWEEIQPLAKEYLDLTTELVEIEPRHGTLESWKKHATAYQGEAEKLLAAIEKQDKEPAQNAWRNLNNACKTCHADHKFGDE